VDEDLGTRFRQRGFEEKQEEMVSSSTTITLLLSLSCNQSLALPFLTIYMSYDSSLKQTTSSWSWNEAVCSFDSRHCSRKRADTENDTGTTEQVA
jgi:hypothetical protein